MIIITNHLSQRLNLINQSCNYYHFNQQSHFLNKKQITQSKKKTLFYDLKNTVCNCICFYLQFIIHLD